MEELISVIVPIYNVAPYLKTCVNSILGQTYKNIEVILVDDGSTDGSAKICDDFKQNDGRVKVIHQKNGGLTVTRRAGANLAQGEYIGFVDGDDWIERDMYQVLFHYIDSEKTDIVTSRGYREYEWGRGGQILGDTVASGRYEISEEKDYILSCVFPGIYGKKEYMNGAVWNKLFRASIIREVLNGVGDNVHGFMDDTVCIVGSIIKSKSIYVSRDVLYHHREREGAFTHSKNPRGLLQVNYGYLALKKMIENSVYKEKLLPALCEYVSHSFFDAYNNFFETDQCAIPGYLFRSKRIPEGSSVLIYGAGKVGKSYWRQLKAEGRYRLMGFVDKNADKAVDLEEVYRIDQVRRLKFDFVVVAVKDEAIVEEIRSDLVKNEVNLEKIIWEQPLSIIEYFRLPM